MNAQDAKLVELEAAAQAAAERADEAEARAKSAEEQAVMALELSEQGAGALAPETLRFYGFADMAFKRQFIPTNGHLNGLVDDSSTFALGNVNLYIDATPNDQFRALTEVRFTLYPWGSSNDSFDPYTENVVYDIASATGRNKVVWSGIVIERAWIEWNKHDFLQIRAGYFLTPYGIWNVDHGSPTLISSVLPDFWAGEFFPTRQLGVQALGDFFIDHWQLGYRAYISNGRSPGQLDVDKNKHIGGQLYAAYTENFWLKFGGSGFWGQNAYFDKEITSTTPFRVGSTKTVEYTEFGLAGDVAFDVEKLRVRAEVVMNREDYTEGLRAPTSPVTFRPDRTRMSTYGVVAYRLPWAGLEPFVFLEHARRPAPDSNVANVWSGGLIWHMAAATQLKGQGYYAQFPNDDEFTDADLSNFPGMDFRVVTAF